MLCSQAFSLFFLISPYGFVSVVSSCILQVIRNYASDYKMKWLWGVMCVFVGLGGFYSALCVFVYVFTFLVVKSQEMEVVRGWEMGSRPGLITSQWYSKHHSSWKLVLSLFLCRCLFLSLLYRLCIKKHLNIMDKKNFFWFCDVFCVWPSSRIFASRQCLAFPHIQIQSHTGEWQYTVSFLVYSLSHTFGALIG